MKYKTHSYLVPSDPKAIGDDVTEELNWEAEAGWHPKLMSQVEDREGTWTTILFEYTGEKIPGKEKKFL